MENTQAPEKQDRDSPFLKIINVWETIQGEGPYAGTPAVFVRLAGCNLQCPLCDTDYTTNARLKTPEIVIEKIREVRDSGLVVLTGGEPLRQNIARFVSCLLDMKYEVQIETNGTMFIPELEWSKVITVCCPKTKKLNSKIIPYIDAWKYIIEYGQTDDEDGLPVHGLGYPGPPARPWDFEHSETDPTVYVQPLDAQDEIKNKLNLKEAIRVAMRYDYRLSLQTHKLMELE